MNVNPVQEAILPMSVKILSTVETSCATNPQQIETQEGSAFIFGDTQISLNTVWGWRKKASTPKPALSI